MIIGTDDRKGIKWPLFAALVVVCALLFAGASFMQQSALTSKVNGQESKASAIVRQTVSPAIQGESLAKPLPAATAGKLRSQLRNGVLAGGVIVRVRIFAQDGTLLFSTDAVFLGHLLGGLSHELAGRRFAREPGNGGNEILRTQMGKCAELGAEALTPLRGHERVAKLA